MLAIPKDFKYTYDSAELVLKDFARYCISLGKSERQSIQQRCRLQHIWETLDGTMCLKRNRLKDREDLEDLYFLPLFGQILKNSRLPTSKTEKHNQASTVGSCLLALVTFCDFLLVRDIFIDLTPTQIGRLKDKIKELLKRLHPYVIARQITVFKWKQENLLSMDDFIRIGSSDHAIAMEKILNDPDSSEIKLTRSIAIQCRDLLIFLICQGNAARSSNICEMTIADFEEAKEASEYTSNKNAMVMVSDLYKTSMIYGAKLIILPGDIFLEMRNYIKFLRPLLITDDTTDGHNRYIFTSSRVKVDKKAEKKTKSETGKMTSSNVANACSSVYIKAEMGDKFSSKRCSPTRIRHAVATQLAGYDNEKLDVVAKVFMKNREGTTQKFYVQYWNQREAIRLSMKMFERTRGEIQIDLPKPNPVDKEECIKWYEENKKRISSEHRLDLNDRDLEKSMFGELDERIDDFQTLVDEEVTDLKEPLNEAEDLINSATSSGSDRKELEIETDEPADLEKVTDSKKHPTEAEDSAKTGTSSESEPQKHQIETYEKTDLAEATTSVELQMEVEDLAKEKQAVETTETSTKEPDFQIETVNQQSKSRKCLVKMSPIKINETQPITRYEIDENGK
uniref:Uncharacterized protein n=2 Tax=Clytia hemisphaerica TaxID=252671 RepID=A0A7M5UPK2_9CNID